MADRPSDAPRWTPTVYGLPFDRASIPESPLSASMSSWMPFEDVERWLTEVRDEERARAERLADALRTVQAVGDRAAVQVADAALADSPVPARPPETWDGINGPDALPDSWNDRQVRFTRENIARYPDAKFPYVALLPVLDALDAARAARPEPPARAEAAHQIRLMEFAPHEGNHRWVGESPEFCARCGEVKDGV